MGESHNQPFQLSFNRFLRVDFQGSRVSSDGEKQTKQVSKTAKRPTMRPEGGYVDLNLTREGGRRMVFAQRQS